MTKQNDTLVFIPAWNEEQNLAAVLHELRAELPDADVLVVDDGSTDRTPHIAREQGAEVLSFGENRGLRAAIAAGYGYARRARLRVLRPRRRRRAAPGRGAAEAARDRALGQERRGGRLAVRHGRRNGFSRERYKTSPRAAWAPGS